MISVHHLRQERRQLEAYRAAHRRRIVAACLYAAPGICALAFWIAAVAQLGGH